MQMKALARTERMNSRLMKMAITGPTRSWSRHQRQGSVEFPGCSMVRLDELQLESIDRYATKNCDYYIMLKTTPTDHIRVTPLNLRTTPRPHPIFVNMQN